MSDSPTPEAASEPSPWLAAPANACRQGLLAVLVLTPVAVLLALALDGGDGALGAALGALVPAVVVVLTWAAVHAGASRSATAFAGLLMGSYLVKLVLVGVVLAVITSVDGADTTALGLTAVVGLLLALVVEARVVTGTRAPYVEP